MNNIEGARAAQDAALEQDTYTTNDTPLKGYSQVFDAVTFCPALSDSAYRTYMILKTHDHGHGVFPGIARLAKYQGLSRRTIQSNMEEIKALGLVTVKRRGFGRTNIYTMAFAPALSLPSARPVDDASSDAEPTPEQEKCNLLHIKRSATDDTSRSATDDTQDVQSVAHKALRSSKQTKSEAEGTVGNGPSDGNRGTGADAPPAADAAPTPLFHDHENDDDDETEDLDAPPFTVDAPPSSASEKPSASQPPVTTPTVKRAKAERTPTPIEAHYLALTGQSLATMAPQKQKYLIRDAHNLRDATASLAEACAVMDAVYNVTWANGVHPYRVPLKLTQCVELVGAYRAGDLGGTPATVSAADSRHPAYAPPPTQTADPDCPLCEGMGMVRDVVSPTEIRAARCSCVTRAATGAGVAS